MNQEEWNHGSVVLTLAEMLVEALGGLHAEAMSPGHIVASSSSVLDNPAQTVIKVLESFPQVVAELSLARASYLKVVRELSDREGLEAAYTRRRDFE